MTSAALGLSANDFDAYHPQRASSNAYSRPRLEFKQRALGWARRVTSRLADLGITVDVHGSDEHPSLWNHHRVDCQWVFFWWDAHARADIDAVLDMRRGIVQSVRDPSPVHRHAFLALRLDAEAVEICVQVHPDAWLDFETIEARLADSDRAVALVSAITRLPEQFVFGVGRDAATPCSAAQVQGIVTALRQARERSETFWVGWRIPREVAVEHSALLDDQLEDAIIALAPVYRELSWNPDDDPAGLGERLEQMRHEARRAAAQRAEQDQRRDAETEALRAERTEKSRERTREKVDYAARPSISLATLFKDTGATPAPPTVTAAHRPHRAAPQRPAAKPARKHQEQAAAREAVPQRPAPDSPSPPTQPRPAHGYRDTDVVDDPHGVLDKGAKVRVNSGPFAGKVGVISELDGRGGARVLLGLLSTRLAIADLCVVTDARERAPIHTSHRRTPIRSGK